MKRLLIYLFVLFSISAGAQTTTTTQWLGAPNTLTVNRGVLQSDSGYYNALKDTTFTPARVGLQIFRPGDGLYVSISTSAAKKWQKLGEAGSGGAWGSITGTLSSQSDLQAALNAKQNSITVGTSLEYLKGDLTLGTFSTDVRSVGDAAYSQLGHTHTASQITDFTTAGRALISGSGDISYNPSTGVISYTGTGSGSYSFTAPLNNSAGTVSMTQANGSTNGYLSATDWNTFNNKQATITAAYPSYINSNVIGIDTALMTTKDRVKAMIDSAKAVNTPTLQQVLTKGSTGAINDGLIWMESVNSIGGKARMLLESVDYAADSVATGSFYSYSTSNPFRRAQLKVDYKRLGVWMKVNPKWRSGNYEADYRGAQVLPESGLFRLDTLLEGTGSDSLLTIRNGVVGRIAAGGGGASLPDQTGNAGKVLTTDGSSAQWTGTARYSFTNLQDGQLIKAQISGGDTTFVNFTPTYGSGSSTGDTIYYGASVPSEKKKNGWFNTLNHHYYILNDEGTHYIGYAPADSIAIGTTGGGGGTYEAESDTYFTRVATAGGTLSTAEKGYINDAIVSLKSAGLYADLYELFPIVGGVAASNRLGFKNTANMDWYGGWTHAATGAQADGSTGYANTTVVPSVLNSGSGYAMGLYSRQNIFSSSFNYQTDLGVRDGSSYGTMLTAGFKLPSMGYYTAQIAEAADGTNANAVAASARGFFMASRGASGGTKLYKDGTLAATGTTVRGTEPTNPLYLGRDFGDNINNWSNREYSLLIFFSRSLTDSEAATVNTIVSTLITNLAR